MGKILFEPKELKQMSGELKLFALKALIKTDSK